jgi:hypothetical protein
MPRYLIAACWMSDLEAVMETRIVEAPDYVEAERLGERLIRALHPSIEDDCPDGLPQIDALQLDFPQDWEVWTAKDVENFAGEDDPGLASDEADRLVRERREY